MIVRSKAPFRVSFGGGGTDMAPYCTEHGGCVISTAIDKHVYVSLKPRSDKTIRVISVDFNKEYLFDIGEKKYREEYALFQGVVNFLGIKKGFEIITSADLPPGSGMGGSSSLCVALIGAFNTFYDIGMSPQVIAQKAYDIERIELDQKGGYQDQYAAAFGGFNYIKFNFDVKVIPIKTNAEMINELQYRMILCYVGGSHFSSDIQDEVLKGYELKEKSYLESMQDLKDMARAMKKIVESNDPSKLDEFGQLLHEGWLAKKSLSSKISNNSIENYYLTSRKHGVIGGKLLGAGGGGHLLLFSEAEQKHVVIKELEKIGGKIVDFHFNPNGVETWKIT